MQRIFTFLIGRCHVKRFLFAFYISDVVPFLSGSSFTKWMYCLIVGCECEMSAHEWVIYSYFFASFIFAIKISSIFSLSYCHMVDTKNVTKCLNTKRCREKKIENEEEMQINKTLSVLLLLFCLLNILRSLNFIRIFAPLALSLSVCLFVCEECSVELFFRASAIWMRQ